ncbi:MAG: FAD-binding protein [Pseudonocardia sp.]|nr:FAD-binding protein [Pseudonocardia sp.]
MGDADAGSSVRATTLAALVAELGEDVLITDPDAMDGYRRDWASLVPAGLPAAVARPRTVDEVSHCLRWANEHGVSVVPRGAGTGLSGGATALDGCLVISLMRMNRIREIDADERLAVVEPGVLNADVGRAAARYGLVYPPDPGSFEISTIGGNLATNAGGMRCVKYGVTRNSVLSLQVVLADGRVLETGRRTVKSVTGYDLTGLFVGSEGTLGVITAATLRLRPKPPGETMTFVAMFKSTLDAAEAVAAITRAGHVPSVLEFMDRATINAIEDYKPQGLDRTAAAMLIGQSDTTDAAEEVAQMAACCDTAGASASFRSTDPFEAEALMAARRLAGIATMEAGPTIVEDVAVPRAKLVDMLRRIDEISRRTGIDVAIVAHAGDGNLHPTLRLPDLEEPTLARANLAAHQICSAALALGGTITGEHGVGALKRPWLAEQFDDTITSVHQALKSALDPRGILNPGRGF